MIRTWLGRRRVALVPVWNRQVDIEPPGNWVEQVRSRLFFDPDPGTGIDRSLQRYIQTVSSGRAYIEGTVFPTVAAEDEDTVGAGLRSLPANHNYDYAMIVLPHAVGPHRGGWAWYNGAPVNGISNFARVAMFADRILDQRQNIGVWAMELLHIVTWFGDLYNVWPQLNRFDIMACSCGTHPSTHTKSRIGWLDDGAVRTHSLGTSNSYVLHAVSQPQPPPPWRTTAVRVQSSRTSAHFLIEARMGTDIYDGVSQVSAGIPSEGVIVYEVQGDTELFLRTPVALRAGDEFTDSEEGLRVRVLNHQTGGFSIQVQSEVVHLCEDLVEEIKTLRLLLQVERDMVRRKQLISAIAQARAKLRAMDCLPFTGFPTELFKPPLDSDSHVRQEVESPALEGGDHD